MFSFFVWELGTSNQLISVKEPAFYYILHRASDLDWLSGM